MKIMFNRFKHLPIHVLKRLLYGNNYTNLWPLYLPEGINGRDWSRVDTECDMISPYHNHFIIYLKSQVSNKSISCPAGRYGSPFKIYRISISALERVWYGIRITPLGNMVLQALISIIYEKNIFLLNIW